MGSEMGGLWWAEKIIQNMEINKLDGKKYFPYIIFPTPQSHLLSLLSPSFILLILSLTLSSNNPFNFDTIISMYVPTYQPLYLVSSTHLPYIFCYCKCYSVIASFRNHGSSWQDNKLSLKTKFRDKSGTNPARINAPCSYLEERKKLCKSFLPALQFSFVKEKKENCQSKQILDFLFSFILYLMERNYRGLWWRSANTLDSSIGARLIIMTFPIFLTGIFLLKFLL